ncbi:MAG: hypothetical protein HUJ56_07630 [Erysipelotrichaceae bacterium]|nr:hypothetical protein [Erysipelotrichaceae bacterium]
MEEIYLIDLKFDTFDVSDEPGDPYYMNVAEARIYSDSVGEAFCSVEVEAPEEPYFGAPDFANLYKTDRSIIDELVENRYKDENYALCTYLDETRLDYLPVYEFYEDKDYELRDVYRLLIYLCRVSEAEREYMIDYADGKCMHEVDVPVCDVEKENS